eukprot:scaffold4037_cov145-Skeletonema_marinoi.AAC.11
MRIRVVVDELEWKRPPSGRKLRYCYHRNKFTPSNHLHESFSTVEPMHRLPCFPRVKCCIFENIIFCPRSSASTDLGSCSSALHSEDTKGYVIPPGQPGKKDRNIENEKTNFFVGVPKLCGLNTDANPHIQNQKHCDYDD